MREREGERTGDLSSLPKLSNWNTPTIRIDKPNKPDRLCGKVRKKITPLNTEIKEAVKESERKREKKRKQ